MYRIPLYKPTLDGNEKKYVNQCLDSTWISSKGKFIKRFEDSVKNYLSIDYASCVSNGTVALHLALLSLEIGIGDEVIVPSFTYIASVNSITYTGAKAVFADSLEDTWQIDPVDIESKITQKTKAIMVVHLYGHPCEMDEILKITEKYKLYLIEDAAEALGAKYKSKYIGTIGDISTFSFFGNKTITTGEGGMVVTKNQDFYNKIEHFKGQGLVSNKEYWHDVVGYNYRMTNIQAAIGTAQIERIENILIKKRKIAKLYDKLLYHLPINLHNEKKNVVHSYWMYTFLVKDELIRDGLRQYLNQNGIETRPTFYPVHTMPMYFQKNQKLNVAENISKRGINLPSYPDLSIDEIEFICEKIKSFFETI